MAIGKKGTFATVGYDTPDFGQMAREFTHDILAIEQQKKKERAAEEAKRQAQIANDGKLMKESIATMTKDNEKWDDRIKGVRTEILTTGVDLNYQANKRISHGVGTQEDMEMYANTKVLPQKIATLGAQIENSAKILQDADPDANSTAIKRAKAAIETTEVKIDENTGKLKLRVTADSEEWMDENTYAQLYSSILAENVVPKYELEDVLLEQSKRLEVAYTDVTDVTGKRVKTGSLVGLDGAIEAIMPESTPEKEVNNPNYIKWQRKYGEGTVDEFRDWLREDLTSRKAIDYVKKDPQIDRDAKKGVKIKNWSILKGDDQKTQTAITIGEDGKTIEGRGIGFEIPATELSTLTAAGKTVPTHAFVDKKGDVYFKGVSPYKISEKLTKLAESKGVDKKDLTDEERLQVFDELKAKTRLLTWNKASGNDLTSIEAALKLSGGSLKNFIQSQFTDFEWGESKVKKSDSEQKDVKKMTAAEKIEYYRNLK